MMPGVSSSSKHDRSQAERNRRMHMKHLFSRLASVILPHSSKDEPPAHVLVSEATTQLKYMQERIKELERRKELLKGGEKRTQGQMASSSSSRISAVINLRELENGLEVNLITVSETEFMLGQVISILEEEGGDVVAATYSSVGDGRISYTIYSQAINARIGMETLRINQRLKELFL